MNINAPLFLIWLMMTLCSRAETSTVTEEDKIAQLVAQLKVAAKPGSGVGEAVQNLSVEFQKLDQTKVVESLLPLLMSKQVRVNYLASYVILDCKKGLKPKHLPALKAGWQDDGQWLPNAIANLKTDEATQFLVTKFREKPKTQGQLDWALANLGAEAAKLLMIEFRSANPKSEKFFFSGFRHILKEMEGKGKVILPELMSIAESINNPPALRKEAVLTYIKV